MHLLNEFICPTCLKKCLSGALHPKCEGNIEGLISCWNYKKNTQIIIKEIKYRFYHASIKVLVEYFLQQRQKSKAFDSFLATIPIIIPVPLHPKRQKYRGFNQSELIARNLAKNWKLPFSNKILRRIKYSKPQAELSKKERLENVKNMFTPSVEILRIANRPLINKNIILVDDVWTTGATAQACAEVLKKLGSKKIWMLTLAR